MAEADNSLLDEESEGKKSPCHKFHLELLPVGNSSSEEPKDAFAVRLKNPCGGGGRVELPDCSFGKSEQKSPSGERRKPRTITFGRRCKTKGSSKEGSRKRKGSWNFKLNCCRIRKNLELDIPEPSVGCSSCVCTGYKRTEEHHLGAGIVFEATPPVERCSYLDHYGRDYSRFTPNALSKPQAKPVVDAEPFRVEDWDEQAREQRAREIEEGIDPPPGYRPSRLVPYVGDDLQLVRLAASFKASLAVNSFSPRMMYPRHSASVARAFEPPTTTDMFDEPYVQVTVHTQVDYIHCLVPDLLEITSCSFYWGKMDRYEAEKLLDNKPEGTFLLRDSAQEEYLFSVSFRRYGRSLHARIEQWNHKFSFDSHDPGVFASNTVCGLIEHYKDPSCCMFFEPMLTIPLHRTWAFSLQHLCRAAICSCTSYDGVNKLHLPKRMKSYLKEYHYKQRVRVRRFEPE